MDRTSKTYKIAQRWDKKGIAEHLQSDCNEFMSAPRNDNTSEMGNIIETASNWAKGLTGTVDKNEYEYDCEEGQMSEDKDNKSSLCLPEDPELACDPALLKEEMQQALACIKEAFSPSKIPTFLLKLNDKDRFDFNEFLIWINKTSGSTYVMSSIDESRVTISKISRNLKSEDEEASHTYTESQCPDVESIIEDKDLDDPDRTAVELATQDFSANTRSLMSQLIRGVKIPSKKPKGKSKKVSMSTIGIPEHKVVEILINHPDITMENLIKKIFNKKGTWKLINSLYEVKNLTLIEPK